MKFSIKLFTFICFVFSTTIFAYVPPPAKLCNDNSRECVIDTANQYLQALISHDASKVSLTNDAKRFENGINTGDSGKKIADSLENDFGFKTIKGLRNIRWFVEGNEAVAFYLIDVVIPHTNWQVATTHVTERFKVNNGEIAEIEAIFCSSVDKDPESDQAPAKSKSILCNRSVL